MPQKVAIKTLTCFAGRAVPAGFCTKSVRALAQKAAQQGFRLCYGGGETGLLAVLAEVFHGAGRPLHSVLLKEEAVPRYASSANVVRVASPAERSQVLLQRADAVCVFPGAWGTLAELFFLLHACAENSEVAKPCVLFNVDGVFDRLLEALEKMQQDDWLPVLQNLLVTCDVENAAAFLRKAT
jgi:predicted Rossmann-fold nucleotide-binding protein